MVRASDSKRGITRRNMPAPMKPKSTVSALPDPTAPGAEPPAFIPPDAVRNFRYESISQPVLPRRQFRKRMGTHAAAAASLVCAALAIGVAGYRGFAGMGWVDALLNASMILSGMGPVGELKSDAAKLFAAGYALFSGIMFIVTAGLLVSPIAHRMLHRLHADGGDA
jgi:hypothetical protein